MGHADFFPNGGFIQPGCPTNSGCSHSRSNQYYIESITSNAFRSKNCSSYGEFLAGNCDLNAEAFMGNGVSTDARGNFYLQTNEESPFAQG
ncbi:pancreatic triacylglycerol lipase-like [Artemia franciscana]